VDVVFDDMKNDGFEEIRPLFFKQVQPSLYGKSSYVKTTEDRAGLNPLKDLSFGGPSCPRCDKLLF